jgi:hypothetical protein
MLTVGYTYPQTLGGPPVRALGSRRGTSGAVSLVALILGSGLGDWAQDFVKTETGSVSGRVVTSFAPFWSIRY